MNRCINFIFRVDSSSEIGHGHMMRCLILAQKLKEYGASIHFICRNNSGSAHGLVTEAGYKLHLLNGKKIKSKSLHPEDWLNCTQVEDAEACNFILTQLIGRHVIVDHYSLDIEWESRVHCERLTVIDDMANRRHACDRLIDQSLNHTKMDYINLIKGEFEFFGGANVILRDEFNKAKEWENPDDNSLMICMGGADPQGVTIRVVKSVVEYFKQSHNHEFVKKIDVVIGQAFEQEEELANCLTDCTTITFKIHRNHPNISALMAGANFCILSCGTMILEACALGVPSIGIPLAINQKNTASFLMENKAILLVEIDQSFEDNLISKINKGLGTRDKLLTLSKHAKTMINKGFSEFIARELFYEY